MVKLVLPPEEKRARLWRKKFIILTGQNNQQLKKYKSLVKGYSRVCFRDGVSRGYDMVLGTELGPCPLHDHCRGG